jgi:hypothetical protein
MKFLFGIIFILFISNTTSGQRADKWNAGAELDVLPYVTGGYFAAIWTGKDKYRTRILTASVHKPDWSTKKGFKNHHITAYALVFDIFLKPEWEGWWVGGGPVLWKSSIQGEANSDMVKFSNTLINGSLGYHFVLRRHIYISPWAGLSLKVAGDSNIDVNSKIYNLPLLNPEMSLKAGIFF